MKHVCSVQGVQLCSLLPVAVMFPFWQLQKFPADQTILHEYDIMAHGVRIRETDCCQRPVHDVVLHAAAHAMSMEMKILSEKDVWCAMFEFLSADSERARQFGRCKKGFMKECGFKSMNEYKGRLASELCITDEMSLYLLAHTVCMHISVYFRFSVWSTRALDASQGCLLKFAVMPDNRWVVCEDLSGPVFDTTLLQADSTGESEAEGAVLTAAIQGEAHKCESVDVCEGDDTDDSYDQSGYAYYEGQDEEQTSDVDVDMNHDTDNVSMHVAEPSQVDTCVSQAVPTDHDDAVSCAAKESHEAVKPVESCYDRDDSDHSCVAQDSDEQADSDLISCVDEDTDGCVDGDHSCVDQDSDDHEDSDHMSCTDKQSDDCLDSDLHEDDATAPLFVDNDTDV